MRLPAESRRAAAGGCQAARRPACGVRASCAVSRDGTGLALLRTKRKRSTRHRGSSLRPRRRLVELSGRGRGRARRGPPRRGGRGWADVRRAAGRAATVRLSVEAAIVDGDLLRGDIEVVDGRILAVGLHRSKAAASPHRLRRPAGERLRRISTSLPLTPPATRRRARRCSERRHVVSADPDHRAGGVTARSSEVLPRDEQAGPRISASTSRARSSHHCGSERTHRRRDAIPTGLYSSDC